MPCKCRTPIWVFGERDSKPITDFGYWVCRLTYVMSCLRSADARTHTDVNECLFVHAKIAVRACRRVGGSSAIVDTPTPSRPTQGTYSCSCGRLLLDCSAQLHFFFSPSGGLQRFTCFGHAVRVRVTGAGPCPFCSIALILVSGFSGVRDVFFSVYLAVAIESGTCETAGQRVGRYHCLFVRAWFVGLCFLLVCVCLSVIVGCLHVVSADLCA